MDNIEVINLKPKFLSFYEKASNERLSGDEIWSLWKEHYNFSAVPPGEQGEIMARTLLEQAWSKYKECIDYIEQWSPELNKVKHYLKKIKSLFGYNGNVNFVLIYYVGGFENNAFITQYDEKRLALCLPIENANDEISLTHELTHILHSEIADYSAKWERTIATIILQEGLATQVSKFLVPGKVDELYIEYTTNWLKSCDERKEDIIKGIYPYLEDSSSDIVYLFTIGNGTTGHEREAYFVGWELVKVFLKEGISFEELSKIKEVDIPKFIKDNLDKILN